MPMGLVQDDQCGSVALIDRWFRELDQRRIHYGAREWLVEVTGILCEDDVLWIQIADHARWAGSVLLCVWPTTSIDQAVRALTVRTARPFSYPDVINAAPMPSGCFPH